MPIVIPSKNIYNIDNDKVIANKINVVDFTYKNSIPIKSPFDTQRNNYSLGASGTASGASNQYIFNWDNLAGTNFYKYALGGGYYSFSFYDKIIIKNSGNKFININQDYDIIMSQRGILIFESNERSEFVSKFRIPYRKVTSFDDFLAIGDTEDLNTLLSNFDNYVIEKTWDNTVNLLWILLKPFCVAVDTLLSDDTKTVIYYKITYFVGTADDTNLRSRQIPYNPSAIKIFLENFSITLNQDILSQKDISSSIGICDNHFSLPNNELSQNTTKNGTTDISTFLSNKIIDSYSNGKETATIKCSINNYYNENNTIAKSITDTTKDMTFRMYDEVIPMVATSNGDAPMSKNADGTAKVFKVLASNIKNNGAIFQTLTLQEK